MDPRSRIKLFKVQTGTTRYDNIEMLVGSLDKFKNYDEMMDFIKNHFKGKIKNKDYSINEYELPFYNIFSRLIKEAEKWKATTIQNYEIVEFKGFNGFILLDNIEDLEKEFKTYDYSDGKGQYSVFVNKRTNEWIYAWKIIDPDGYHKVLFNAYKNKD